jgi:hypothetical protein
MSDVTLLLDAATAGDRKAAADLLPLVYDELRKLAAVRMADEAPDQTLQPTALVHEAYLRLIGPADDARWENRGHFFAAAAEAMRRILVDAARRPWQRPGCRSPPSPSEPPMPTTFDSLYTEFVIMSFDKQLRVADAHGEDAWGFSMTRGEITFKQSIAYKIQILGTERWQASR